MPTWTRCPECKQVAGQPLPIDGGLKRVNYVECQQCGHVWTTPKPPPTRV